MRRKVKSLHSVALTVFILKTILSPFAIAVEESLVVHVISKKRRSMRGRSTRMPWRR